MSEEQQPQLPATEPPSATPNALQISQNNQPLRATERVEMQRATAEVYAAHQRAIQYPRDKAACIDEIMELCGDVNFASEAIYSYSVGGETAEGINTKAAADIAQIWGNIESGIVIHGDYGDHSQVRAFAIDLEKNFPRSSTITVKHERKSGDVVKRVTDPRQIKTLVAAEASKEERNCILRVLPNYLRASIIKKCKQTLHQEVKDLKDAWFGWVKLYEPLGIKEVSLLRYVNRKSPDKLTAADIVDIRLLYGTFRNDPALMNQVFPERDKSKTPAPPKEEGEKKQPATELPKSQKGKNTGQPAASSKSTATNSATSQSTTANTTGSPSESTSAPGEPDPKPPEQSSGSATPASNLSDTSEDTAQSAESTSTDTPATNQAAQPVATVPPKKIRLFGSAPSNS